MTLITNLLNLKISTGTQNPQHQDIASNINYPNGYGAFWTEGSNDTFGVQINGNIEVQEGGFYTFFLGADDGAILIINGEPVVDNNGLHAFRTRTGEIALEPGTHSIEVRYFENFGRAGLTLEWEGPGLEGRELVTAPDMAAAQTVSGMPLAVDIDTGELGLSDDTTFQLTDLPAGTIIETGAATYEADANGSAPLKGWQGEMMTITPPLNFTGTVDASLHHTTPTGQNSNHSGVQTLTFEVNDPILTSPAAEMVGGFHASYFDTDERLSKLDDIDWTSDPTHQEFVPEIDYTNSSDSFWDEGSKDTFGAKLEGKITVEEGGFYTFFAGGDDGVAVFIDGERIINDDGEHSFRTRSGEINLESGTHDVEVRYFENYGHAGLKLEWEGPDTSGRELVQADREPLMNDNGTFEVAFELENLSEHAAVSLDGLPPNTLLVSDEESMVTDGGTADLSGWRLDHLEISPPPGFEGAILGEIAVLDTGFNGSQISAEYPFELQVGQTGDPLKEVACGQNEVFTDLNQAELQTPWHLEALANTDETNGDVMSEVVLTDASPQVSCIETENYERIDW